jgi:hypothetical protein
MFLIRTAASNGFNWLRINPMISLVIDVVEPSGYITKDSVG